MALNKNVANICTMLAILVFSLQLFSSQGRPLPDDDGITSEMQIRRYLLSHGNGVVEGAVSPSSEIGGPMVGASGGVRPTNPGHSPGIGHHVAINGDVDDDDVRPTNPGHSPGIGHHAIVNGADDADDVRPTNPGHSPGIGHAVVNSADDDADDVRPTNPGHSPGIGHAFVNKIDGPAGKKKL
ncbi:Os03g0394200 [Oryza sativa Japonica Group]|uniref:Os03g0394200 protein n=1 Tax=Oryza sativa subsp. japonica TaxID=39947 RepID=A0A0P0VYC9_ORYSJ|nr:precursor of CEP9 [Oryza sativa Japonica Group]BAS84549.1 Os03g0394200 [Oryza sativa Japonica Group]